MRAGAASSSSTRATSSRIGRAKGPLRRIGGIRSFTKTNGVGWVSVTLYLVSVVCCVHTSVKTDRDRTRDVSHAARGNQGFEKFLHVCGLVF